MGYRSDVAIAIYGEEDQMVAFIAASRLNQNFAEIFKECEIYPYNSCTYGDVPSSPHLMLLAQFNDVKWYDGYSVVDCWNSFVSLAQDHDEFINTEFVRAGEESDDNVHEQTGPNVEYHLGISREVYTDLPKKREEANEATAAA